MGSIKKYVFEDITIIKAVGPLIQNEIISILEDLYTHSPTKFIIWDLVEASAKYLTSKHIHQIADFVAQYKDKRAGGKTALVASGDLEFGISRMMNILGEIKEVDFEVMVFRNLSDAANWIGVKELPKIC